MLFQLCPVKTHRGSWAWGSMEKGEPRFPRVHLLLLVLCQGSIIHRFYSDIYTDIKIARNTKINHIMVSFTDRHNAISIDRFPSKTKVWKDPWYFNNSVLCKPEVLSYKDFFFLIKNTKKQVQLQRTPYIWKLNLQTKIFLTVPML